MERKTLQIKSDIRYKEFLHSKFNGFRVEYPSTLRGVLEPSEYDNIIQSVNSNSIRSKRTPVLNGITVTGEILCSILIGVPLFIGGMIGNHVIYKRWNKKLQKDIKKVLDHINQNPILMEKGISFSLECKTKMNAGSAQEKEYNIVCSYLQHPFPETIQLYNTINSNNRTASSSTSTTTTTNDAERNIRQGSQKMNQKEIDKMAKSIGIDDYDDFTKPSLSKSAAAAVEV